MICGATVIAIGFLCMFLEFRGMGADLVTLWLILWGAGTISTVFGAILFCLKTPPRELVSFAVRAIAVFISVTILVAIISPDNNVHGPIMPVIIALVSLTALGCAVLLYGLVGLLIARHSRTLS